MTLARRLLIAGGGASWFADQISSTSDDVFDLVRVQDAHRLLTVWMDGTATDYTDWSASMAGAATY